MKTSNLITGRTVRDQINQAARHAASKEFYTASQDGQGNTVNRQEEIRRYVREKLTELNHALKEEERVLVVDHKKIAAYELGTKGILRIVGIPAGEADPDYPTTGETGTQSHGGILASPHIDVTIDTVGEPSCIELAGGSSNQWRVAEGEATLQVPLNRALNFTVDQSLFTDPWAEVPPYTLPEVKRGQLQMYGSLLIVGSSASDAYMQYLGNRLAELGADATATA